jgi:hypothetical protein
VQETIGGQTIATTTVAFLPLPLVRQVPVRPLLHRVTVSATKVSVSRKAYGAKVPPVGSYELSLDQGKTWLNFPGSANTFVVRTLTPHHPYVLELRAVNANGIGPWSRPFRFVTPV